MSSGAVLPITGAVAPTVGEGRSSAHVPFALRLRGFVPGYSTGPQPKTTWGRTVLLHIQLNAYMINSESCLELVGRLLMLAPTG